MLWVLISWQFFCCSDTYKAEWEIPVNFHVSKINLHCFFLNSLVISKESVPWTGFFLELSLVLGPYSYITVCYAAAPKQIQGKLGRRRECCIVSEWKCFSLLERQRGCFLQTPPSTPCVVVCVYCILQVRAVWEQLQSKKTWVWFIHVESRMMVSSLITTGALERATALTFSLLERERS